MLCDVQTDKAVVTMDIEEEGILAKILVHSIIGFTLTLQETLSIHDSMNIPKIEFIAYIYILL